MKRFGFIASIAFAIVVSLGFASCTVTVSPSNNNSAGSLGAATAISSDISSNTTWTTGNSYRVSNGKNLHVLDGATLTIQAGVTVYFDSDCELTFDATSRLVTQGTSASPITFTSSNASPAKGDWDGIVVYSNNASFKYCVVEYAGYNAGYAAIYVNSGANVTASYCTIAHNKYNGIDAGSATNSSISVTVSNCTIYDNAGIPLIADDGVSFETGNVFNSGSTVNGKQYIYFDGNIGSVRSFAITALPYDMASSSNTHILPGCSLTVASGVTLQFETDCMLTVDTTGALSASGATFTSSNASPAKGDWDGITVNGTATLAACIIQYAGYNSGYWAIDANTGSTLSVTASTIQHVKWGGIAVYNATASITNNTIQTAYNGISSTADNTHPYYISYNGTPTISGNIYVLEP